MLKRISLLVALLLIFNTSISFAQAKPDIQYLQNKYDFEIVNPEDVPSNITPIEVKSLKELEKILKQNSKNLLNSNNNMDNSIIVHSGQANNSITPMGLWPSQPATHTKTVSFYPTSHRLVSEVGYYYAWDDYNSRLIITGIRYKSIYFTYTMNYEWEQEAYTATIAPNASKIDVYIRGNVYSYLAFEGNIIKTLSNRVDTTYSIYPNE